VEEHAAAASIAKARKIRFIPCLLKSGPSEEIDRLRPVASL